MVHYQPPYNTSYTMKSSEPLLRWYFALQDVSRRQSCHLSTLSHPRVPYCRQAQCGRWRLLKWSIANLLASSHPQMSASHFLGLQGPQKTHAWTFFHNVWSIKIRKIRYINCLCEFIMTLLANPHFMPRPLKWSKLGAHTMILSKNIHKVKKTDYVWFEFLWIRRYV